MLNYKYIFEQNQLDEVLSWANDRRFVVLDTETNGLDALRSKVILIQLGDTEQQWVIDNRVVNVEPLRPLIESDTVLKVGTNLKFDWQMLFTNKKWSMQKVYDAMIGEQVLRCGLYVKVGLDSLMLRYFNQVINKDETLRRSFSGTAVNAFSKEQLDYAAGDCIWPLMIAQKQKAELKSRGLWKTASLEFDFLPILADMELRGMSVDVDQWKLLYQNSIKELFLAEKELDKFFQVVPLQQEALFGEAELVRNISYSSSHQIKKALLRKGFDVPDTNEKTLSLLAINGLVPKDFVEPLLRYRLNFTRMTRYGLNFLDAIDPITDRIHTIFGQTWTNTGRLNSGQKAGELGDTEEDNIPYRVNFQNIPSDPEYRHCFIPKPGNVFIIFDHQAIEPRILGELSNDPTYLHAFDNNLDIYGVVGEKIYGEYVGKKTGRGKELRDKTKVVVLGNAYGTGKEKFHKKLLVDMNMSKSGILKDPIQYITREESDRLWESFFEICPGIKKTLDNLSALADPLLSNRKIYDAVAAQDSYDDVYKNCYEHLAERRGPHEADAIARRLANDRAYLTYAESLGGRKRYFKVTSRSSWSEARDIPMQGTAASILKSGMVGINKAFKEHGHDAYFVNQVHDEVVIECRADQAEEICTYVKPILEKEGQKYLKRVPCKVEGGIHNFWHKD